MHFLILKTCYDVYIALDVKYNRVLLQNVMRSFAQTLYGTFIQNAVKRCK